MAKKPKAVPVETTLADRLQAALDEAGYVVAVNSAEADGRGLTYTAETDGGPVYDRIGGTGSEAALIESAVRAFPRHAGIV